MGLTLLTERHEKQIAGVLSCWDRMLVFGTLPKICYAEGMTSWLYANKIRIFDYPRFAEPFRDQLKQNAERLATENGLTVEFLRKRNVRKEDRVKEVLATRGEHPGLVCIFSAMEPCSTYKPWHDKQTGKTYLLPDDGKCLHYYFYFIDEELGLCYVRVPTWLPCRLQIYFNGHNWLAAQLRKRNIEFDLADNAFTRIGDWSRAQQTANGWDPKRIHARLDRFARTFCPIFRSFGVQISASMPPTSCFTGRRILRAFTTTWSGPPFTPSSRTTSQHFLGRKLNSQYEGEMGNRFDVRIEGTRIRHTMGPVSLKLYDKFGLILRIETTVNDLTLPRGGTPRRLTRNQMGLHAEDYLQPARFARTARGVQPALSRVPLRHRRSAGRQGQARQTLPDSSAGGQVVPGFNLFDPDDDILLRSVARGEFNISGLQNKTLRRFLPDKTSAQVSRLLKRLRLHGIIKKVGNTYKYYLTTFGKQVVTAGTKLRELVLIPQLATS